eukprot:g40805.t1
MHIRSFRSTSGKKKQVLGAKNSDKKYAPFRLEFVVVFEQIKPQKINGCIQKVAVALRMLAGASYLDVADIHGVSDTSVYYILHRFCAAVNGNPLFDFKLGFDNTSYLQHLDNGFEKRSTALGFLKGCIGALDGLVVAIKCPDKRDVPNPSRYYCRKGHYGLNLQAMCDSDLRFTWEEMKWPGSTNDSLALQSSSLMHTLLKKKLKSQYFIVADNGYPIILSDHVLTPYKGRTLTTERDTFNFYLSQKRQTIERAFGVLIGRWEILWKPLRFDFKHAISITKACMRLHNFLIDDNSSHISLMEMCLVPIDDEHGAGVEAYGEICASGNVVLRKLHEFRYGHARPFAKLCPRRILWDLDEATTTLTSEDLRQYSTFLVSRRSVDTRLHCVVWFANAGRWHYYNPDRPATLFERGCLAETLTGCLSVRPQVQAEDAGGTPDQDGSERSCFLLSLARALMVAHSHDPGDLSYNRRIGHPWLLLVSSIWRGLLLKDEERALWLTNGPTRAEMLQRLFAPLDCRAPDFKGLGARVRDCSGRNGAVVE